MDSAEVPVVDTPGGIDFAVGDLPERPTHGTVLLVEPTHFDVRNGVF